MDRSSTKSAALKYYKGYRAAMLATTGEALPVMKTVRPTWNPGRKSTYGWLSKLGSLFGYPK